ncbi:MAG TPA: hypothetical protein GX500_01960 [Firmicutes bacterium]|nr:hypothetical protein [Candidatus Fermentithermobacillaceae bacterium]
MSRRVDVEIGRAGQVRIEFSGFEGDLCYEEAEALARALRSLGLKAVPLSVVPKSPSEIEAEIGMEDPQRRKVPVN